LLRLRQIRREIARIDEEAARAKAELYAERTVVMREANSPPDKESQRKIAIAAGISQTRVNQIVNS
jgi:hypothetical protein